MTNDKWGKIPFNTTTNKTCTVSATAAICSQYYVLITMFKTLKDIVQNYILSTMNTTKILKFP